MPKINVYLPDDLADAVRETGLPVSAICQRALESAVRRLTAIRQTALGDLDPATFADQLVAFTPRLVSVLALATERAKAAGATRATTGHLLGGLLAEGGNLALQILTTMDVAPASLTAPDEPDEPDQPGAGGDGLRFSQSAAIVLEQTVGEAIGLGHNYVGCEHLLIALAGEPGGKAGELLRSRGVEARSARQSVAAALAGYAHLRRSIGPQQPSTGGLLTAVRSELAPLVERIERLEARIPA